jgi:hypothetical protein
MNKEEFQANVQQWYQEKRWVALLPLLEYSFSEAQHLVQTSLKAIETNTTEDIQFLYEEIVHFVLVDDVSAYWKELAIQWMQQGMTASERIVLALEQQVTNKAITQKARQVAKKIVQHKNRPFEPL